MKHLPWILSCSRLFSGSAIWLSTHTSDSEKQTVRAAGSTGNLSIRVADCEQLRPLAGAWCPLGWPASLESSLHDSENAPLSWGEGGAREEVAASAAREVSTRGHTACSDLTRSLSASPTIAVQVPLFGVPMALFWANTPVLAEGAQRLGCRHGECKWPTCHLPCFPLLGSTVLVTN